LNKIIILSLLLVVSTLSRAQLSPELMPNVRTLPSQYPDTWIFAHDVNFSALIAGRVVIVDVAAQNRHYKGALDAAQFATFTESSRRSELYVGETFYSRGTRGERSDILTIYDKSTLQRLAELPLPGGKRGQVVSNKYAMQLIDNDKYLLIFNFTPAASVTLIDLETRRILSEVQIPGCSMMYPSGRRGFSSLCGNGSLIHYQFNKDGSVASQKRMPAFFDVDDDPLFDKPVYVESVAYFPSFKGVVQTVNFSGAVPKFEAPWSFLSKGEQKENWRPGGWQIISADKSGQLYLLMHADGYNGSHKGGGTQVWVVDVNQKKTVKKIQLKTAGFSIEVTRGEQTFIVVTNVDMSIDVYNAEGEWLRTIGGIGSEPIALHSKR
jgi:methylamine dehydrogenase heavy chain